MADAFSILQDQSSHSFSEFDGCCWQQECPHGPTPSNVGGACVLPTLAAARAKPESYFPSCCQSVLASDAAGANGYPNPSHLRSATGSAIYKKVSRSI